MGSIRSALTEDRLNNRGRLGLFTAGCFFLYINADALLDPSIAGAVTHSQIALGGAAVAWVISEVVPQRLTAVIIALRLLVVALAALFLFAVSLFTLFYWHMGPV